MAFTEHLEELRWRLIKSLIAIGVGFAISLIFSRPLTSALNQPVIFALRKAGVEEGKIIAIRPTEGFITPIMICAIVGIFAASPFIIYQIWKFVAAGLYPSERKWVYVFGPFSGLLFIAGCAFSFMVVVRWGLVFLAKFSLAHGYEPYYTAHEYVRILLIFTLTMGVVFQLPLVMLFLTRIGVATPEGLARIRRYAILCIFIAGAVLSPPDPFTMIGMALPMIMLYEVGIILCKFARRREEKLAG
jgi:sec-independent protein translocase protein TatC